MITLDRKCANPECGKYLEVDETSRRYKRALVEKKYCHSSCGARAKAIATGQGLKTHTCEICGALVPWITKNGKPVEASNYRIKRTCNDPECYKALRKQTADIKSGKASALRYYERPDIIEQWCLTRR